MKNDTVRILLIGFGNPGRLDDGLGPAFAELFSSFQLPGVVIDSDYQLVVENAAEIAGFDVVVFADASVEGREPFYFEEIVPTQAMSFSSHSVSPQAVLSMTRDLFNAPTRGYLLGIRGYEFNEYTERLSPKAEDNLRQAADFLKKVILSNDFTGHLLSR